MKSELINRIVTSIILFPILIYITFNAGNFLISFLLLVYFICIYEIIINTKNLLFILFSGILLFFSFYSFYFLRGDTEYSLIILFWILNSTFFSDIGGYIFGKIFKGKRLTKLSPNKTYSGAIGSIALSCLSLPLMNFFQNYFFTKLLLNFFQPKFIIITILISLTCQFGDIFISSLKRKINIKDISNFLPGHGGFLNRIDVLIFVLLFCLILKLFAII